LDIDTEKGTIEAKMFSPYTKKYMEDQNASFSFSDVKFIR
jgi:hypothetical protein